LYEKYGFSIIFFTNVDSRSRPKNFGSGIIKNFRSAGSSSTTLRTDSIVKKRGGGEAFFFSSIAKKQGSLALCFHHSISEVEKFYSVLACSMYVFVERP
jgi:hypothetical protein